jgi:hypothetical protein
LLNTIYEVNLTIFVKAKMLKTKKPAQVNFQEQRISENLMVDGGFGKRSPFVLKNSGGGLKSLESISYRP